MDPLLKAAYAGESTLKSASRRITNYPEEAKACTERKMTPMEEQVNGLSTGLKHLSEIVGGLEDALSPILEPEKCCEACNEKDARPVQAPLVAELRGLNETLYYLTNRVRNIRTRIQL